MVKHTDSLETLYFNTVYQMCPADQWSNTLKDFNIL